MLRMRTKLSVLVAAVVAAVAGVNNANAAATFDITYTQYSLAGVTFAAGAGGYSRFTPTAQATNFATQLDAAGWIAMKITATATGASTGLSGYDFQGVTSGYDGTAFGAFGTFHQATDDNVTPTFYPERGLNLNVPVPNPTTGGSPDSFLNQGGGTLAINPQPTENTVFTGSPLVDATEAFFYGTSTFIKGNAAIAITPGASVDLGWFIVPKNTQIHLVGLLFDQGAAPNAMQVDALIGPSAIPEPASLGVLAMGGLALLARRRKA